MRVIAGKYRSRPLRSLRGMDIRPTSDRLRETLFNILTAGNPAALTGSVWLDLYAGTGAVGIEALSRGAGMVYFVESLKAAAELIGENWKSLAQLEGSGVVADFVFLDPPYRMEQEYARTLEALAESKMVRASSAVIAEHEKRFDPGDG